MTIPRRKLTTLDKLKIALAQAICSLCKRPIGSDSPADYDHIHALALGGTDTLDNLRVVHRECHAVKTRGAGGTTLRSDQGEMRKNRQLAKKRAAREAKATGEPPPARTKPKAKIPSPPKKARPKQHRASGFKRRGV